MFKHMLIPTDGSTLSQKAVTQGVALAKSVGAKITAFYAAPPATPIVYRNNLPVGYATPAEHEEMIEKTAARYLEFVERAARKAGVACEVVHVVTDYPEEGILKIARKKKCDLIVMATHGQGGCAASSSAVSLRKSSTSRRRRYWSSDDARDPSRWFKPTECVVASFIFT